MSKKSDVYGTSFGKVPPSIIVRLSKFIAVGAIEFALTVYGPAFTMSGATAIPCWPPAGFALAVLLLAGFRYLPSVAIGSWLGYFLLFQGVTDAAATAALTAGLTVGFLAQISIGAVAAQRYVDPSVVFERAQQTIVFFAILIASTIVGSVNTVFVLGSASLRDWSEFGQTIYATTVGSTLSIVHFVSIALLWLTGSSHRTVRTRALEFTALMIVTIVVTAAIFTDLLTGAAHSAQLYLVFPLILWAVFRFYPKDMIVILTVMSAITLYGSTSGTGPFKTDDPGETMLNTLTYIGIGVLVAMTLSTIAAQQKRAEFRLRRLNNSLERRVSERTAELAKAIETLHSEVAERRRAERELAESQDRKAAIVDTALDGIISIRSDGSIAEFNPAAEAIFDYDSREIDTLCFADLIVDSAARKARELGIENYLRSESRALIGNRVEMNCRRSDQTEFPVEISMVPVVDGAELLYICNVRDITREKSDERERELLNLKLVDASHRAGMAEIANGVLHNIGNVLNSVNVSAAIIAEKVRSSRIQGLQDAIDLLNEHRMNLGEFFTSEGRGEHLLTYLNVLGGQLAHERNLVLAEFSSVSKNVLHIKEIIARQQSYASHACSPEPIDIEDLVHDAIAANLSREERSSVETRFSSALKIEADRHNVLQIIGNLLQNARDAIAGMHADSRPRIVVQARFADDSNIEITVEDNGTGIESTELDNIFHYAYTTKRHGHGFGLHSSHAAARNMGGKLKGSSAGAGLGARFTLRLPIVCTDGV